MLESDDLTSEQRRSLTWEVWLDYPRLLIEIALWNSVPLSVVLWSEGHPLALGFLVVCGLIGCVMIGLTCHYHWHPGIPGRLPTPFCACVLVIYQLFIVGIVLYFYLR